MMIVAVFCLNLAHPGFGLQYHLIQQEGMPATKKDPSSGDSIA